MSWLSWILTSNNHHLLPDPLRSRCTIVKLPQLKLSELSDFAARQGKQRGLSQMSISAILEALQAVPHSMPTRPSLRTVNRMLDRAADMEARTLLS